MNKFTHFFAKAIVRTTRKRKALYDRIYAHYLRGEFRHLGSHAIIENPSYIMNPQCMSIGDHFTARPGVQLRAYTAYGHTQFKPEVLIGHHVHLAADCTINCCVRIEIGDYSGIGTGSRIMDHSHGLPDYSDLPIPVMQRLIKSRGGVTIGKNVMVGSCVMIVAGIEIGDNAVIGANSVVTKSIPANSIAVGVPARVIRTINA